MTDRTELLLSGMGGQGIVFAGKLLAEAAALHAGYEAVQTIRYSPEVRGGESVSEIIISPNPIDYPRVIQMDAALVLSPINLALYRNCFKPDARIVLDSELPFNELSPGWKLIRLPLTTLWKRPNLAGLGGLLAVLEPLLPATALLAALRSHLAPAAFEVNQKAFIAGFNAGKAVTRSFF
ncbi:MAG: hypothetical protein A2293_10750 [Elusimicrobia bacterium RIFOXYB2_FULL_49_7]|nr:MAG: hypothetical protein A2293_10750 [Elusimicrobia bacterium RIFOXYB2_FULL_49_7]